MYSIITAVSMHLSSLLVYKILEAIHFYTDPYYYISTTVLNDNYYNKYIPIFQFLYAHGDLFICYLLSVLLSYLNMVFCYYIATLFPQEGTFANGESK